MVSPLLKNKLIYSVILSLIVFVVAVLAFIYVKNEIREVSGKKQELASLKRDLIDLDKVLSDLKVSKDEITFVSRTLPASPEAVAFALSQSERLAKDNGQILTTEVDEKSNIDTKTDPNVVLIQKTGGNFSNYTKYLSSVANLPYHTKINSLDIKKDGYGILTVINYSLYLDNKMIIK